MAAAVAKTSNEGRTGAGTSFTISFASLPTAGSSIVVTVWGWRSAADQSFTTVTDNQGVGNSYTKDIQSTATSGDNSVVAVFRCGAIGATSGTFTLTVNQGNGAGVGYAYEVTGMNTGGTPTDQSTTTNDAAANTSDSSGTTSSTTQADDAAFAATCNEAPSLTSEAYTANASGSNPSSGWTINSETDNNTYQCGSSAWRVLTATGAINHTWTLGTAAHDSSGIIVYKAAAAAAAQLPKPYIVMNALYRSVNY